MRNQRTNRRCVTPTPNETTTAQSQGLPGNFRRIEIKTTLTKKVRGFGAYTRTPCPMRPCLLFGEAGTNCGDEKIKKMAAEKLPPSNFFSPEVGRTSPGKSRTQLLHPLQPAFEPVESQFRRHVLGSPALDFAHRSLYPSSMFTGADAPKQMASWMCLAALLAFPLR